MSMIFQILVYSVLFVALPELFYLIGVGIACYAGCRAVNRKQIGNLIVTITIMLCILSVMRVAQPIFKQFHDTKNKVKSYTDYLKVDEELDEETKDVEQNDKLDEYVNKVPILKELNKYPKKGE